MLQHVKQHVRPEELCIPVLVRGSAITPLLREKDSHKTLANSLTMNTLVATVAGWKGKQQAGYW